jgi:flagellar motor switch protein FliN/FliY
MSQTASHTPNLDVILDVPFHLSVELGVARLPMRDVLQLGPGSVVQLDTPAEEPVNLFVNGKLVARGDVVVVDDHFGVKIKEVFGNTKQP